jgi:hypothetical protein
VALGKNEFDFVDPFALFMVLHICMKPCFLAQIAALRYRGKETIELTA